MRNEYDARVDYRGYSLTRRSDSQSILPAQCFEPLKSIDGLHVSPSLQSPPNPKGCGCWSISPVPVRSSGVDAVVSTQPKEAPNLNGDLAGPPEDSITPLDSRRKRGEQLSFRDKEIGQRVYHSPGSFSRNDGLVRRAKIEVMNTRPSKYPSKTENLCPQHPTVRHMYRGHVSVPSEQVTPVDNIKRVLAAVTSSARNTVTGSTTTTGLSQSIVPSGNTVRNHIIGGTSTEPEHTTHVFFCCFPADWFSWLRVISINRATVPSSAQPNESCDGGTPCQHQQAMSRFEEEMIDMEAHRQRIADVYEWP